MVKSMDMLMLVHLNVDAPMTGLLKHQYMYNTKIPVKEWEHCFIMN